MNTLQETLLIAGFLLLAHAGVCIYILARKSNGSRKRGLVIIIGNYVLLLVFYIPATLAPQKYSWLFAVCFVAGFASLLRYVAWLRKRDDETPA